MALPQQTAAVPVEAKNSELSELTYPHRNTMSRSQDEIAQIILNQRLAIAQLQGTTFHHATILDKHFPEPELLTLEDMSIDLEVQLKAQPVTASTRGVVIDAEDDRCVVEFYDGTSQSFKIPLTRAEKESSPLLVLRPTVILSKGGETTERIIPVAMYESLEPADLVKVNCSGAICELTAFRAPGAIGQVLRSIDEQLMEVDIQGNKVAVRSGKFDLKEGTYVLLDQTNSIVTTDLGRANKQLFYTQNTNVTWESIGGLEAQKAQVREAIEGVHADKAIYEYFNKRPVKGILLWGPPGCGKTLIGKAAASAIATLYTGNSQSKGFIYVNSPALLDRWVGSTETAIRSIFKTAQEFYEEHGYPAVIFMDEFDAIGKRRGSGISTDVNDSIVPALLNEMDGLETSHALLILGTNRPDVLDPALTRDGRIDRKIQIPRPDDVSTLGILKIHLEKIPLETDIATAADFICQEIFSDEYKLTRLSVAIGSGIQAKERSEYFRLRDILSGAMLEGVCERAASIAINRCRKEGDLSPVRLEEFKAAIQEIYLENLDLKHIEAIRDFAENKGIADAIKGVETLRARN